MSRRSSPSCGAPRSGAGPGGIFTLALAAIDLALWDIKGKALGQTLNAMAGGARDRVQYVRVGALMRPHPLDYLRDAGPRLVEMGFKPDEDAARLPEPTVSRVDRAHQDAA